MCGIAGYVGDHDSATLGRMLNSIAHRGPDAQVEYHRGTVHFAHARLSIIDTSTEANQPMESQRKDTVIVFNGEIYNFKSLRSELEQSGYQFKTHSDTEVILALYARDGRDVFKRLEGMFAIALYDFSTQTLVLARDRVGEKPLYVAQRGSTYFFASELRALIDARAVARDIDQESLALFLAHDYVPAPRTLIKGVEKLLPATVLEIRDGARTEYSFWQPPQTEDCSYTEARTTLDDVLGHAVEDTLVSDVPLGVFLSGGLDSSTVAFYAARARKQLGQGLDTFSIGFSDAAFDESQYARSVATHLGTRHHEKIVSANDVLDVVPQLASILSEPISDPSVIPTYLLSCFAREHVTVALGGDGGDELFAGYPTFRADVAGRLLSQLPYPLVRALQGAADMLPVSHGYFTFGYSARKTLSSTERQAHLRHAEWLGTFSQERVRELLTTTPRLTREGYYAHVSRAYSDASKLDPGSRVLYTYLMSYLTDQVLAKVDRASMQMGLEVRAPLLHRPVLDFALALPYRYKYTNGTTKFLLKELMRDRLPAGIADRGKQGFALPIAAWLNGPLEPLMLDLLSTSALKRHGLFAQHEVEQLIDTHRSGRRDNRKELWNLMVFQLWYDRWIAA